MKIFFFVFSLCSLCLCANCVLFAQEPEPKLPKLILAEETPVALKVKETITSADAAVHDLVDFEVAEDVKAGDHIVIPRGSYAWGVVTAAARKSRMRRNGRVDIDLQAVCLPDGRAALLRAMRRGTQNPEGNDVSASDSIFALPALPVMVFVWGKDVVIPAGREFTTYLAEDTDVSIDAGLKPAKQCPVPEAKPVDLLAEAKTREELSTLNVRSTPPNAEIYIDGKFMGNTPAVLKLPPGEHQVRLAAPGLSRWERLMAMTPGGDTNVQVKLESLVVVQK